MDNALAAVFIPAEVLKLANCVRVNKLMMA